jgi:hypothetical protein
MAIPLAISVCLQSRCSGIANTGPTPVEHHAVEVTAMQYSWNSVVTHLTWTWHSISLTDYWWAIIGLLATGWFLSTLRRP